MFEFWVTGDAAQCVSADVAFADVPVTIDAGVVSGARVVEVDGAHVSDLHCLLHSLQQRVQAVFLTDVVAGRERVCCVEANADRKLRAESHDHVEMFEAMADAVALSGSVLEQDTQRTEPQTFARNLQTLRTQSKRILFTRTAATAGMDHQVIDAEKQRTLDLFAKRLPRFLQHQIVGGGKIDEVVAVNQDR